MGYSFVLLSANRHDKFKREHKNAITAHALARMVVQNYTNAFTDDHRFVLGLDEDGRAMLSRLKPGLALNDPDVVDWVKRYHAMDPAVIQTEYRTMQNFASIWNLSSLMPNVDKFGGICDKYPLLIGQSRAYNRFKTDDVVEYINAVYNARKGI
jgi:hypothetical protein